MKKHALKMIFVFSLCLSSAFTTQIDDQNAEDKEAAHDKLMQLEYQYCESRSEEDREGLARSIEQQRKLIDSLIANDSK